MPGSSANMTAESQTLKRKHNCALARRQPRMRWSHFHCLLFFKNVHIMLPFICTVSPKQNVRLQPAITLIPVEQCVLQGQSGATHPQSKPRPIVHVFMPLLDNDFQRFQRRPLASFHNNY